MFERRTVIAIVLVATLSSSTPGMPDTSQAATTPTQRSGARMGTHAVAGLVTFADASRLVIVRSGKDAAKMAFVLNPSTCRDGELKVGSMVSVRYLTERRTLVATGVFVHERRTLREAEVPIN
jgi:hypothetical protein